MTFPVTFSVTFLVTLNEGLNKGSSKVEALHCKVYRVGFGVLGLDSKL